MSELQKVCYGSGRTVVWFEVHEQDINLNVFFHRMKKPHMCYDGVKLCYY